MEAGRTVWVPVSTFASNDNSIVADFRSHGICRGSFCSYQRRKSDSVEVLSMNIYNALLVRG